MAASGDSPTGKHSCRPGPAPGRSPERPARPDIAWRPSRRTAGDGGVGQRDSEGITERVRGRLRAECSRDRPGGRHAGLSAPWWARPVARRTRLGSRVEPGARRPLVSSTRQNLGYWAPSPRSGSPQPAADPGRPWRVFCRLPGTAPCGQWGPLRPGVPVRSSTPQAGAGPPRVCRVFSPGPGRAGPPVRPETGPFLRPCSQQPADTPVRGEANFQLQGHRITVNCVRLSISLGFKDKAWLWPLPPVAAVAVCRFGSRLPTARPPPPPPPRAPGTPPGPPTAPPTSSQPEAHVSHRLVAEPWGELLLRVPTTHRQPGGPCHAATRPVAPPHVWASSHVPADFPPHNPRPAPTAVGGFVPPAPAAPQQFPEAGASGCQP